MRFKVVPDPAASLEAVAEVRAGVPLVPDDETSCCARLMRRTDLASQDAAKEWLTFLRALELVEEVDGRYRRLSTSGEGGTGPDDALDSERLRAAFRERIYLADEVLEVLEAADGPLDEEAVFDRVRDRLPRWERLRHTDPEGVWRERVRRILEWSALFDLASRTDDGYERSGDRESESGSPA